MCMIIFKKGTVDSLLFPLYHFHPLYRHANFIRTITTGNSTLHTNSGQTQSRNAWFSSVSYGHVNGHVKAIILKKVSQTQTIFFWKIADPFLFVSVHDNFYLFYLFFFFSLSGFSFTENSRITWQQGNGDSTSSYSLPLPPALQTLKLYPGNYSMELTSTRRWW